MGNQGLYAEVPEAFVEEGCDLPHSGRMEIREGAVVSGLNHVQQD
jgi:hypothetical protein